MHIILIYIGVFFGVFIEGEMVLISAVIAAHHGHLNLWLVIALGIIGTFTSDAFYFFIGKKHGIKWINRKEKLKDKSELIHQKLERYPKLILLSYRFLYGFRAITPIVVGTGKTKNSTFFIFSAISILFWAATYCILGYIFGELIKSELSHIEHVEFYIIGVLLTLALVILGFKRKYQNRKLLTDNY